MTTMMRRGALMLAAVGLLLPVLAVPAAAHVTANPNEANSPYATTWLRVSHGCDGAATTAVRVQIPDGVSNPRPEVVDGWEVEIVRGDGGTGAAQSDDDPAPVSEVAWVGGNLPDTQFQQFGLTFRVGDDAPEVLWFPVVQECEEGVHRWIEIPSTVAEWSDLDEPAPYVINNVGADRGASDDVVDTSGGSTEAGSTPTGAESSGSGTDPVAVIALVAALLALAAGVGALITGRRRSAPTA